MAEYSRWVMLRKWQKEYAAHAPISSLQIEYAQKATENAGTVIGIKCSDGILLAVEKLVQTKLLVPGSNKRIYTVDYHAGIASAGLIADGKHLAGRAREEAIAFRDTYRYKSPVKVN
jgi:20S proteasome subunit alpha 7